MSLFRLGFCFLGCVAMSAALAPKTRATTQAASTGTEIHLTRTRTFSKPSANHTISPPGLNSTANFNKDLLEFLQKEDKKLPHQHIGTKREVALQQAADTTEMLRLFRPCARCSHYKRYGSAHGGGYVMCEEAMQGIKAVYSFGIEGNDDWGADVSTNYAVPIYQFDCYHKTRPNCPAGRTCDFHFAEECLGSQQNSQDDTRTFRSLEEHLDRYTPLHGQPIPRGGDLLLKVDVEGREWHTFINARLQDLQRMRQIVVEFHDISQVEFHGSFVLALQRIMEAGFIVAHIHGNNFGPMALFGDGSFKLADDVEVTFINKLAMPTGLDTTCRTIGERLPEDSVDNRFNFDLPVAQLPSDSDSIEPAIVKVITCRWWCNMYSVALWIGPFVLLTTFILLFMVVVGLLISRPSFHSRAAGKVPGMG